MHPHNHLLQGLFLQLRMLRLIATLCCMLLSLTLNFVRGSVMEG